jgi:antirestriction protein
MEINIYLTDLAEYNNGNLKGEWLKLHDMSEKDLKKAIKRILGKHEEYFITDYEAPFKIEEYSNPYELREYAEELNSLEDYEAVAVKYLVDDCGYSLTEAMEKYRDGIVHQADSLEDLAEQFVNDGLYGDIPESIQYYIDYEKIARDLDCDGYKEIRYNDQTYYVDGNSF